MPKMKPHTGMGKRVKVTGSGKIVSAAGRASATAWRSSPPARPGD